MRLLEKINLSGWTAVAVQEFDGARTNVGWEWLCDNREAAEITLRIEAGIYISSQRKAGPGVYERVVRVAKKPPKDAEEKMARHRSTRRNPLVSDYDKMMDGR